MAKAKPASVRVESNLALGILAGFVAAIVGAAIWAAITAVTSYQIGFMAIGVGFLVGFAVHQVGKGSTPPFGVAGAVLALLGCVAGNVLTAGWFFAANTGVPYGSFLMGLDPGFMIEMLRATFSAMDLVFYAIAAYCGYRFALTPIVPARAAAKS
jgi:hypothetical protein